MAAGKFVEFISRMVAEYPELMEIIKDSPDLSVRQFVRRKDN